MTSNQSETPDNSPEPNSAAAPVISTEARGEGEQLDNARPLLKCDADTGELFRIHLVNYFLTIITLGFYRFWAKTRMRRYLWSHVAIEGTRLEYTGTAKELFIGFLIVFFLILLPITVGLNALQMYYGPEKPFWIDSGSGLLIWFLIGVGFYRARRYRLTRTRWRGISGGQVGSAAKYGLMFILSIFAAFITLGLAWPACSRVLMRYRLNNTRVGDQAVSADARLWALYKTFFAVLLPAGLAAVVAFGFLFSQIAKMETTDPGQLSPAAFSSLFLLVWLSGIASSIGVLLYKAGELRQFVNGLTFHGLSVQARFSLFRVFRLVVGNMLIQVFTLGLGAPWAIKRILDFMEESLFVEGEADFTVLMQSALEKPSYGEGLADAFDIGAV